MHADENLAKNIIFSEIYAIIYSVNQSVDIKREGKPGYLGYHRDD